MMNETAEQRRFRIFRAQRREFVLADLVAEGNEPARSFQENGAPERVLGYYGDDELTGPHGFIGLDQEYWLILGNCEWTADNEDDLITLEKELFDWMCGEEYIELTE